MLSDDARGIIVPQATGVVIEGGHVETDASGLLAKSDYGNGIDTSTGVVDVQITGNAISANEKPTDTSTVIGLIVVNASYAIVLGNRIGVGANGLTSSGNMSDGIFANSTLTAQIGDGTAQSANIVASATLAIPAVRSVPIPVAASTRDVTANESGNGNSGPGDLLDYSVTDQFVANGSTAVSCTIGPDVPANGDEYRVEFFTTATPDATNGESGLCPGTVDVT